MSEPTLVELLRRPKAYGKYEDEANEAADLIESQQATITELTAENNRLVPESKQCHLRNDELVHEHIALQARAALKDLS